MIETLPPSSETPAAVTTDEPMETSVSPSPPVVNGENKENQDAPPIAEPSKTDDANANIDEEKQTPDAEKVHHTFFHSLCIFSFMNNKSN